MEPSVICVICDSQLIDADDKAVNAASALPCGHVFHKSCVCQWLELHSSCPICRQAVVKGQLVEKLYFNTGSSEAGPADPFMPDCSTTQPWYERYATELALAGGVVLGAIGGIVLGSTLGSQTGKKKK